MDDRGRFRRVAKRSKAAVIGVRIANDRASLVRNRLQRPNKHMGATHMKFDLDASVSYVDGVYEDFLRYGRLDREKIEGTRVLELGPGDNLGIPLRFLADGAEHVTTMDRFFSWRDDAQQREIYEAMLGRMDDAGRKRAEAAWTSRNPIRFDPERLDVYEGVGAEQAGATLGPETFDLVVSRAVLEHVNGMDAAFRSMDVVLRPGGTMIHKVDFRDHGLFTYGGHPPLTFLTIPDRIYSWMGDNSGLPNRHLIDYYRDQVSTLGYESEFFVTHTVGRTEELTPHPKEVPEADLELARPVMDPIRSKLRPRYRALSDEELAISGIFFWARKPGGPTPGAASH